MWRTGRRPTAEILLAWFLIVGSAVAAEPTREPPAAPETGVTAEEVPLPKETESGPSKPAATSLTQSLQGDSGVAIQTICTNCNNADLSLGGLGNEHVAVICDGIPVPSGLAQIYLLSVLPPTMIDKVAVRKGAGQADLEGGAVGGVIEIERREPAEQLALNVSADTGDYGWDGARLDLSGRAGRFGGAFVGSWATSDVVPGRDIGGNVYSVLPSFDRFTLDGTADVDLGQDRRLRLGGVVYDESQKDAPAAYYSSFSPAFPSAYNKENVELKRRQLDAAFASPFGAGAQFDVMLGWADRSQDVSETAIPTPGFPFSPTYLIDESRWHGSTSWSQHVGQSAIVRGGVSGSRGDYTVLDVRFSGVPFDERLTETGLWAEGETPIGDRVELVAGLRWADYSYSDDEERPGWTDLALPEGSRLLPRAALTYKPIDPVELRFSAGTGFRAPEPTYEEVCCGRRYRNNRGIRAERSRSFGVELVVQPRPRVRAAASLFLTDFDDLVIKMASASFNFVNTFQNVNVAQARHTSLALETRTEVTRWLTVRGSASWLDAENRSSGDEIVAIADLGFGPTEAVFKTGTIPYTVERRGSVGVDFRPPQSDVTFGVAAQYTGPTLIQEFDSFLGAQPDAFVSTESFWVVNFNVAVPFPSGLAWYAGVDNLSDYTQADLGDPHFDFNWGPLRGRYYYTGLRYRLGS